MSSSLPPGARLGRYEIKSQLGAGGMGEVYLAQDTRLRRKVALKILPADFTDNKDREKRFEREAFAVSSLNHPNILTIYEIGAENEHLFIATEFIDGKSLRQHTGRTGPEVREVLDNSFCSHRDWQDVLFFCSIFYFPVLFSLTLSDQQNNVLTLLESLGWQ